MDLVQKQGSPTTTLTLGHRLSTTGLHRVYGTEMVKVLFL
jgi:hypothetical protein